MVVVIKPLFFEQFRKCPISFQIAFRKIYQQLKVVDDPLEIKCITSNYTNKKHYKLLLDKSRISLKVEKNQLVVIGFFYNQYFSEQD
jgi:hypothetical protein